MAGSEVLCIGEILWDALPEGLFLGGAPFNVACHLRATGAPVAMVSRIGADRLGEEALRRATRYGVSTELIQVDDTLPTGFVRVDVDQTGNPGYDILEPASWDALELTGELRARAQRARAIVFGTLAQRHVTSRATIQRLWDTKALAVFDVNLRAPYEDREIVAASLHRADVVKLSGDELRRLAGWFGLVGDLQQSTTALAELFACPVVCVTRGGEGAVMLRDGKWSEHSGYPVDVRNTVGAGDAFLAVLLAGLLAGGSDSTLLQHANLIGSYVATQYGAVPADQNAATTPPLTATKRPPRAKRKTR